MHLHCFHKDTSPTCLSHLADHTVPLTVRAFDGGYTARPICYSAFPHWSASLASPDNPSRMPSAEPRPKGRVSRGSPDCFQRVTVGSTCCANLSITGYFRLCCTLTPCASCLKSAPFNRFRSPGACTSAHVFAASLLKGSLRKTPLLLATQAVT